MISMFARQSLIIRKGEYGQAAMLLLTTFTAILSVVFLAIYVTHLGAEKVATANAIDAIALSAATWEARALNTIAALNDGILQCFRLIRWTSALWAAMAVAALGGVGLTTFLDYSRRAVRIIQSAWETARQLALWAEKVKDAVPYLILAETARLSRERTVTGGLYPFNPRGPHDHAQTLELHVTKGPPLTLSDALTPIHRVKQKIGKWKWARKIGGKIIGIIDSVLHAALGSDPAPIHMLFPEKDLLRRQKVRFGGFRTVSSVPIPFFPPPSKNRFFMKSAAEVYGGSATEMSWRSRFTEWEMNR